MISDVIRCSINVFRCSIDVFRCSQGALNCPQTFYRHTQMYSRCVRCPKMFKDVFRCSQMFLDVLKLLSWCSQDLSIMFSRCSHDIWSNFNLKVSHVLNPVLKIWFGPPNADFWSVWSSQKARKFRQIQPTTKVRILCFEWKRICFQTRDVLCSYNMNYEE